MSEEDFLSEHLSPLEGAPLVGAVEYAKFQGPFRSVNLAGTCVTSVINSKRNVQRKVDNHFPSHRPETIYTNLSILVLI